MAPTDTLGTFFADRGEPRRDRRRRGSAPEGSDPDQGQDDPDSHDAWDAGPGPAAGLTVEDVALVAEAAARSGVVWLRPAGDPRTWCAWHVWHDDAVLVVHGTDEQTLPVMTGLVEVMLPSKDSGARLVTVTALARVLTAGTPEWDAAADALAAKRLNAADTEHQRERWATGSLVTRLDPLALVHAGPGDDDSGSGAAPVPPADGTTTTWRPFHLGSRDRRARALRRRAAVAERQDRR